MSESRINEGDRAVLDEYVSHIEDRVEILRDAEPYLIDMSAREATLSSYVGHTLDDKIALYEMSRDLGFNDFGLSNFFAFPSVSDAFMDYLVEAGESLDPFFATIAVEPLRAGQAFPEGPAAQQTKNYGIPNIILLVETRPSTLRSLEVEKDKMLDDIRAHIDEYRRLLPPSGDRRGRIYIRMADPFDTYDEDPAYLLQVIKMLGEQDITGILFEDVKGTRFPFETYALVRMMRHYLPRPRKILAHPHTANGTEDAAVLEAILAGGDGVWSGFTPQAAQGGHGSALIFLTNLMRAKNPHVRRLFNTEKFQDVAERMWQIHDQVDIPPNTPVVGERAYLYVDQLFAQTDEPRDLDPALIGRQPGYQLMPAWGPAHVIAARLSDLGYGEDVTGNQALLAHMRKLMNAGLLEGKHVHYDKPEHLTSLLEAAAADLGDVAPSEPSAGASALTQRYR